MTNNLPSSIAEQRAAQSGYGVASQTENLGEASNLLPPVLDQLTQTQFISRLYERDPSLFAKDAAVHPTVLNRLGWLHVPEMMLKEASGIKAFAEEVRSAGFKHVVLLGMGGSSLCPEVCARTFGPQQGYPELVVLDTTSPDVIRAGEARIDIMKSLFIPASKSGGTIETNSLYKYFWQRLADAGVESPGKHFIAITDPGTALEELAAKQGFLKTFINPPDIGGRYSALSFFGLVPMALMGIDVAELLERVHAFSRDSQVAAGADGDPSVRLGAALAALAKAGRDKMTLVISPKLASLGGWIEQLVAESTGKHGLGILPVDGEPLGDASVYRNDRVFVSIALEGDTGESAKLADLEKAGHPVIRINVPTAMDLGVEFYRWELATATAGSLMEINPFDEPNVSESKANTSALIDEFKKLGKLPVPAAGFQWDDVTVTVSQTAQLCIQDLTGNLTDVISRTAQCAKPGDYIALLAYLPYEGKAAEQLEALRVRFRDMTGAATTLGFGPRYLHSTGQLHKGGAANGIFFVFTAAPKAEAAIPGEQYDFATLLHAQALGDFRSLEVHGRRAVLVHLGNNPEQALTSS